MSVQELVFQVDKHMTYAHYFEAKCELVCFLVIFFRFEVIPRKNLKIDKGRVEIGKNLRYVHRFVFFGQSEEVILLPLSHYSISSCWNHTIQTDRPVTDTINAWPTIL